MIENTIKRERMMKPPLTIDIKCEKYYAKLTISSSNEGYAAEIESGDFDKDVHASNAVKNMLFLILCILKRDEETALKELEKILNKGIKNER